jgi:hypothetical protein
MCGCGSSENFMGVALPNQNVYDVGPGQLSSPMMFGTDSMNTLGVSEEYRGGFEMSPNAEGETEMEDEMETAQHETSEPRGAYGEDID